MSRRNLYTLGGLLLVMIAAAYYMFLLKPIRAEIATTKTAISAEEAKLIEAQQELASLQDLQKKAASNQAHLIALAKMMPASKEVPSLLIQIQDLASESGIDFMTITPGEANATLAYAAMPLNLQFSGTFFDINDFLYRVEQMVASPGRLLAVSEVSLALGEEAPAQTSPTLDVQMTIDAFQFVAAAIPDPPPGAGAAPGTPGTPSVPGPGDPGNTAGMPGAPGTSTEQG